MECKSAETDEREEEEILCSEGVSSQYSAVLGDFLDARPREVYVEKEE